MAASMGMSTFRNCRGHKGPVCGLLLAAGLLLSLVRVLNAQPNLRTLPSADQVIAQSRAIAKQALAAPADERQKVFAKSQSLLQEWVRLKADDPRVLLVRSQAAIASSLEAELARQDAELTDDAKLWEVARATVRKAIGEWKLLAADVDAELQRRPRLIRQRPGELTPKELAALGYHCRLQRARMLREQALCYPAVSADRINALSQAIDLLTPLQSVDGNGGVKWWARVEGLICRRMLGDYPAAKKLLDTTLVDECPNELRPQIAAERLRLLIGLQELGDALALATKQPTEQKPSGDLELARLEVFVVGCKSARQETERSHLRQAVIDQVQRLREFHAGYWSRRGEQLAAALPDMQDAVGVDSLIHTAESRTAQGNWREAISAYDRAAAEATKSGDNDRAFNLTLAAGKLAAAHDELQSASERFRAIARQDPTHPGAAEAHLLAIHYAGLVAQQSNPPRLDNYRELLAEHLKTWTSGKTVDQVRWWLGKVRMLDRQWKQAIELFEKLPANDSHFSESRDLIAECREQEVNELETAGKRTEALRVLEPLVRADPHDGRMQEQFARILADSTDANDLEQAMAQWREVQRKSKPGSPRWFRATYGLAKVQHDLRRDSQARALIKLTELAHPDLGGAELRTKFQALLKACEQGNDNAQKR